MVPENHGSMSANLGLLNLPRLWPSFVVAFFVLSPQCCAPKLGNAPGIRLHNGSSRSPQIGTADES